MDGFPVLMLKIEICWESLLMDYRARPTVYYVAFNSIATPV